MNVLRKGLASGIVVSGTGAGVLFFAPVMDVLINYFTKFPEYLGNNLNTVLDTSGKLVAELGPRNFLEVVFASAQELSKLPYNGLVEGYYLVGSGSTGIGMAYGTIGALYTLVLFSSTMMLKSPPSSYNIQTENITEIQNKFDKDVHVDLLLRTPQFTQLLTTSILLSTGGMAMMAVAKPMILEIFSSKLPSLVTMSFATGFLMALSAGIATLKGQSYYFEPRPKTLLRTTLETSLS